MKIFISALLVGFGAIAGASEVPDLPPNACYEGCTPKMAALLKKFDNAKTPSLAPAVYSGECNHLSPNYNADHTHYAFAYVDQNDQNQMKPYLSVIFSFFSEKDDYKSWTLSKARKDMNPEWKKSDRDIKVAAGAGRTIIMSEGAPAMINWIRQDSKTGALYLITYWGGSWMESFCQLHRHAQ